MNLENNRILVLPREVLNSFWAVADRSWKKSSSLSVREVRIAVAGNLSYRNMMLHFLMVSSSTLLVMNEREIEKGGREEV